MQRHEGGYYIRLSVVERPGAMAAIATRMGERKISLEAIMQKARPEGRALQPARAGRPHHPRHDGGLDPRGARLDGRRTAWCARRRRSSGSNGKRGELAHLDGRDKSQGRRRRPPHAVCRDRAHVRHHDLLHRPGHLRQVAERVFADRADRVGALHRGDGDRARRFAISLAAGHPPFEASSATAVALRFAILFDDRERVRRPRAPAVGDCDNLISHAGLRGPSCGTGAGRTSGRGAHDRNRARISRRGDCDAPGNGRVSADRSPRDRRGCL